MKKLAAVLLASSLLAACSNQAPENQYKGDIILSSVQENTMMLTILRNDCQKAAEGIEVAPVPQMISVPYDSNLAVGACALVQEDENGNVQSVTNISRSRSSSLMHRTGKY